MWFHDTAADSRRFGAYSRDAMVEGAPPWQQQYQRGGVAEYKDCTNTPLGGGAGGSRSPHSMPSPNKQASSPKSQLSDDLPMSYREARTRRRYKHSPPMEGDLSGWSPFVAELRAIVPGLSNSFNCSNEDAAALLSMVAASGCNIEIERREAKITELEFEVKTLAKRLERCLDEKEKLKDDVGEFRRKIVAQEQSAKSSLSALSQGRECVRKQLLAEELRTEKLTIQNKSLNAEVDKLKNRIHQMIHTRKSE